MISAVEEFFDADDFAEWAEYTPDGGSMSRILVIFDNGYSATPVMGMEYQNLGPRAFCREADVEGVSKKDTLHIRTTTYNIIDIQSDGNGIVELVLSKD